MKGPAAHQAMLHFGDYSTTWKGPQPVNTGFINLKRGRYIYTKKEGWLDMAHFMFYAGQAYQNKVGGDTNPVGEAVQRGYHQELMDNVAAPHSAYSYEHLPSDRVGAVFGAKVFDPASKLTLGEQVGQYLQSLGATHPKEAPNYSSLPKDDEEVRKNNKPTVINKTTKPLFTTPAP
jgi:hypothetical protein